MSTSILTTKLYIPQTRSKVVARPRLIERLNADFGRKLTLISASAGFGKTMLVSEWVASCECPTAWLSLDEGDKDPTRFLAYFVAALQTLALHDVERGAPRIGEGMLAVLQSPQPPPIESILTVLLNEIAAISNNFLFVLDDYHLIDSLPIDNAITFLLEHLPPQMQIVIVTREDPNLPLARFRVRGQLSELRAADLRFSPDEAAAFLNEVMDLNLTAEEILALETRTEGWIAGLQLAALSMQGQTDKSSFIQSFSGSHRYVLDYLVEEVLQQQSDDIRTFLLRTSILERLCGSLCDAVLGDDAASGQETVAYLERTNLFIVPLDDERRWYRYHHLFAELLRQRLQQEGEAVICKLHGRASQWYEENGLDIEAFHHAAAAHDIDRATRLVEGDGMPLIFRGAEAPVLNWLLSLSIKELNARPALWVIFASAYLFAGQIVDVEEKLQAAEAALVGDVLDAQSKDLIGHIASIRATVAVLQNQVETIITQSQRALEYLHPDNLPVRTATTWSLGVAYQLQGERTAASAAYTEAIAISQAIGHFIITIMSTLGLGNIQEVENQLHLAAETYHHALDLIGEPPQLTAAEGYLGLARINYQWNDLDVAETYVQKSIQLLQQLVYVDRFLVAQLFLVRLRLAQKDVAAASVLLMQAEQLAQQNGLIGLLPEITAVYVLILLAEGNLTAAAQVTQTYDLPMSQARVCMAQGDFSKALAVLEPWRQQVEVKQWADEWLKVMVLQACAYHAHDENDKAVQLMVNALTLAEPEGFIRLFIDAGPPMAQLLSSVAAQGIMPDYTTQLLAAFDVEAEDEGPTTETSVIGHPLAVESLSPRELEVLGLIAQGYSNREISERLFLALDTVKGHNRRIYSKLQVRRRTEAVARARELDLL